MHPLFEKADKLSREVIGAAIEVHRLKGAGLLESIYEKCLLRELSLRGLSAVNQRLVRIEYKGLVFEEPLRFDVLVGRMPPARTQIGSGSSADPPGATPQLHEAAGRSGRTAHQLPRTEARGGHPPDDSPRRESVSKFAKGN